jgi:hypothetical protein
LPKCKSCSNYQHKDWSVNFECKLGYDTPDFGDTEACHSYEEQYTFGMNKGWSEESEKLPKKNDNYNEPDEHNHSYTSGSEYGSDISSGGGYITGPEIARGIGYLALALSALLILLCIIAGNFYLFGDIPPFLPPFGVAISFFLGAYIAERKKGFLGFILGFVCLGVCGYMLDLFMSTHSKIKPTQQLRASGLAVKQQENKFGENPSVQDALFSKISIWKFEENGGIRYLKITKLESNKFAFHTGFMDGDKILWVDHLIKNADGIYLKLIDKELNGEFASSNFYATHGEEFDYKVTIRYKSPNELIYSVHSSFGTDEHEATKLFD